MKRALTFDLTAPSVLTRTTFSPPTNFPSVRMTLAVCPALASLLPSLDHVHLVQRHQERDAPLLHNLERLYRLVLQSLQDIDDEDCDIGRGATPHPELGEDFVAGRVDDEEAWYLQLSPRPVEEVSGYRLEGLDREEARSDLLSDSARFPRLDGGAAYLIE